MSVLLIGERMGGCRGAGGGDWEMGIYGMERSRDPDFGERKLEGEEMVGKRERRCYIRITGL